MSTTPTTLYTPQQMLRAMSHRPKVDSFLRDRLVNQPAILSDKKYIELDKFTEGQGVAVYNSRTGGPTEVAKQGYDTDLHVSPYVFESINQTPSDTDVREMGETIYESDAARNSNSKQMWNLEYLNKRLDRLEEKQIVEAITAGTVTVANAAAGVNYTVDYNMPSDNKVTLTGDNVWGGDDSDIKGNIETWGLRLLELGYPAVDLLLDFQAGQKLSVDTSILALLDNRRVVVGEIETKMIAGQKASKLGTLNLVGVNVDVWIYSGGYETAANTFTSYFDSNRAIMVGAGVEIQQHYGKIENFKANFKGRRFPQMVPDRYGKQIELLMESAPLAVLRNPAAIISAKVGA